MYGAGPDENAKSNKEEPTQWKPKPDKYVKKTEYKMILQLDKEENKVPVMEWWRWMGR